MAAGLAVAAVALAGWWAAGAWLGVRGPAPRAPAGKGDGASPRTGYAAASIPAGPPVEQVQALAALVTVRVDVADVQETRLDGRSGGVRAAVLVRGDFLVGTDLGRAAFEAVDPA